VLAGEGLQISSTLLRKALNKKEGEKLVEELKTMTLSPRLLVSMIQAGQLAMKEKEMAKLKGDSKLRGLVSSEWATKEEV
jgi:hypothetical protein